jgi:Cytochrome c552/Cytochrome c554 and c-prime
MGKKISILLAVAVLGMLLLPALASATLVNDYGMHFAGQAMCVDCHSKFSPDSTLYIQPALHGRFATAGVSPGAPEGWTAFQGAGAVAPVAGTGQVKYAAGGIYSILGLDWVTLGDASGNSATEYLFFQGSKDPTVMPWNLIEGLMWEPTNGGEWMVAAEEPGAGLYDVTYSCQRCHQLGTTMNDKTNTKIVPNPAASVSPSAGTAVQWARDESKSVTDFMSDPSVSVPGLGIQCEQCHGTGQADATNGHASTGVDISTSMDVLGQSQVCGQCHGSYTNVAGTMGIYGYTTNNPLRLFVDVNGASGGQSYTKIPTGEEFAASPTAYWMFPNGSNAKGNHYYYNEWAASAHSYRAALTKTDPDAMAYQASGKGVYSNNLFGTDTVAAGCYKCHTGEGYLQTKGVRMAQGFTPSADTVGKMGQECSTCHGGHPAGVGADNVVREPDKAGQRSAKGLTVDNASICEDCHNWQMEVLGQTPNPAPMTDLAAHGSPSHPQRETLHARSAMFEVANGEEFMPGAECEDCHMPKTNKAETRISHGMKPMLPGDAELWQQQAGYSMGEDSCSGCHPSRTRDELQASIDAWQGKASDKATGVASAIAAAKSRSEFSATVTTNPGYILVGRATWNYKVWENDASDSVHNPPYIMAGLMKAEQMAKSVGGYFTHAAAKTPVKKNHNAHVAGRIVNGDKSAATGAKVVLMRGSKVIGTTLSDATGNFAFTFKVSKTYKNYKVKWVRSSSSRTDKLSAAITIRVN